MAERKMPTNHSQLFKVIDKEIIIAVSDSQMNIVRLWMEFNVEPKL
jgi:hypothetical protein